MYLVWEHFSEDDDRMRSDKQLCEDQPYPTTINGVPAPPPPGVGGIGPGVVNFGVLTQGCEMTSLYSASAFQLPNINALPYIPLLALGARDSGVLPYASNAQSRNLRIIEASINPIYKAKNDTAELNADYTVTPSLTFTSQTAFNNDFLWSTEDYNRFDSAPNVFQAFNGSGSPNPPPTNDTVIVAPYILTFSNPESGERDYAGTFCDPQLGCSNRIVAQDLSDEHAWQLSQEFRLTSNFSGATQFQRRRKLPCIYGKNRRKLLCLHKHAYALYHRLEQ